MVEVSGGPSDIMTLLATVPRGAWVALSNDEKRVLAYGADSALVLSDAAEQGENDPILIRVPESALML